MRHGKSFNHLGRTASHRKALLSNMAISLIMHKRITTTVAKARELRRYVEPIINRSKEDSTHNRRIVFSYLQDKDSIKELFGTISEKVAQRPGGYTRIIKLGTRPGDGSEMAMIELVDFNELLLAGQPAKRTRRSRRGKGGTAASAEVTTSALQEPQIAAAESTEIASSEEVATDSADVAKAEGEAGTDGNAAGEEPKSEDQA